MIVKRVGPLSVGKIMGATYVIIGFFIGAIFSLLSIVGATLGRAGQEAPAMLFGVGAIILFPIMYGVIGLVGGIIFGLIYNMLSSVVGGIEIDLQ